MWIRFAPYIAAFLMGALMAYKVMDWRHKAAMADALKAKDTALTEAWKTCDDQQQKLVEVADAYQKKLMANGSRAHDLTKRVYATCGTLQTKDTPGSSDRGRYGLGLDRDEVAELVEILRKCDTNTEAAKLLNDSWPK